jgi:two-component system sensor histidine kinase RegB
MPPWYLGATSLATLPWLIRLRWITVAIYTGTLVIAWLVPLADFPLRGIAPLLAAAAVFQAAVALSLGRSRRRSKVLGGVALAADVVLLAALLELTGGPLNPFTVVFAVQAALGLFTLGRAGGVLIGALAAVAIGALAYWHIQELDAGHHRLNDFPTHLLTMWLAVTTIGELAGYFIIQASNALARREAELDALRQRAARTDRLVSLTTLAAGAAHELSTPLATIALAARELERAAAARPAPPGFIDDARLIRSEVERCRAILDQMSGRAGGDAAAAPEPINLETLLGGLRGRLPGPLGERLVVKVNPPGLTIQLPRAGLEQAVASLINNALDATAADAAAVVIDAACVGETVRIAVIDQGHGIDAAILERAGEPFFTTKEAGRGLGLGLFLARLFAERCGGRLTLQSDQGTVACLELPLDQAAVI